MWIDFKTVPRYTQDIFFVGRKQNPWKALGIVLVHNKDKQKLAIFIFMCCEVKKQVEIWSHLYQKT